MENETNNYRLTNQTSGVEFGVYSGADELEALEEYAKDAGYETFAEACEVSGTKASQIVATLISLPTERAVLEVCPACGADTILACDDDRDARTEYGRCPDCGDTRLLEVE